MSDRDDDDYEPAIVGLAEQRRFSTLELAINSAPPDGAWDLPETLARAIAFEAFVRDGLPVRKAPTLH